MSMSQHVEWQSLIEQMRIAKLREPARAELISALISQIEAAPKFLFESGPDNPAAACRVHAEAEKLIATGEFNLPAPQVLIEDPISAAVYGAEGRQFYLCTQTPNGIELSQTTRDTLGRFTFFEKPRLIPLSTGTDWNLDSYSPTIAVKEFILAMHSPSAVKIKQPGYTHVAFVRGPVPDTKPATFEDFTEALRQGKMFNTVPADKSFFIDDPNQWSVPVYDFGALLNGTGPGALDKTLVAKLAEDAPATILPAPSCVFLFRYTQDFRGAITRLIRIDGVLVNGKPHISFGCLHIERHLRYSDMTLHPGYWSVLTDQELAEAEDAAKVDVACRLLANWRDNFEVRVSQNYRTGKINAKRASAHYAPIHATQTIHITEQRIVYLRDQIEARSRGHTGRTVSQHLRTISDKWVYPKTPGARQFKPYQRKPRVITVNKDHSPRTVEYTVVP